ncbi:hypothetical protein CLPUN_47000 [Clostridium puniceum]|uniref:Uncharacterized protein n=1 Tax=Clostridium puniceum TaxID=29367 RepID=A0A1S8T3X7_9CLOT|nr:hypothetical protein [Clostridium puniceum]OOM72507.1 hypothetical protein CLPUN_47000 [Clostridium puniceum]
MSVATTSKHLTHEERKARQEQENKLKGKADKLKPPTYLNSHQKKIFKYIVSELESSGILGNLDIYILTTARIEEKTKFEKIDYHAYKCQPRNVIFRSFKNVVF